MILAAVVLATVAAPLAPVATLCVDGACRDASVAIAPRDTVRPFVWISAGAERVIAGELPANATGIPLADERRVAHRLTLATSDGARDVVPEMTLRCASAWTWSWQRMPRQAVEIAHPAGDCTLAVHAAGYRAVERALTTPSLGTLYLQRLPVLSGIVTDARTVTPIEGAQLLLPEGKVLATTDAAGRFRAVVDGPWPSHLRVAAAGRAPRTIEVPKVVADAELQVVLSAGGSLHLTLAPPLGGEALRWELRRIVRDLDDEKVRTGELAAGLAELTIDGVDPGAYRVILAGEGPLQRLAIPVRIIEGHVAEPVAHIEPLRLDLEVTRGDAPFANAEIEFIFRDGAAAWRAIVTTDASGFAAEEIWQRGGFRAAVGLWQEEHRFSGADEEHFAWKLRVPDRVLRGRVLDTATNQPIADVGVLLELRGSSQAFMRTRSDKNGAYEFKMVPVGAYSLRARPAGYEEVTTPLVDLAEDSTLEVRDLRVRAASGHGLRVVNVAGAPVAAASVYIASRNGVRFAGVTNDEGRMTLPLSFDEAGEAFVLPRSGSFALVRFASMAEEGAQELRVTVPDGVASLEMRTISDEGEPIAKVAFIMRVNGVVVPGDIVEAMNREQGLPLWSDADGLLLLARMPAGRYEIWPLTNPADRFAVSSAAPPPAPVNVMLTPGQHQAKLTFKAR